MNITDIKLAPVIATIFAAILAFGIGLALTHSGAKAGVEHEERMTSYHAPTGAEMTPEAVTDLVVRRFARQDGGMFGALTVTTVHTVFAQAMAVADGRTASEAIYGGPPDIAEWRTSPVYMVTMTASPDGRFSPNVSHPPGQAAPSGSVMTVIVDSHTGMKEGLDLASSPPDRLGELGPAFQSSVPAASSAMVASLRHIKLGNVGELSGHIYSHGHPVSRWHVVVGHKLVHHIVAAEKTYTGGIFGFRLPVGVYEVAAKRPNGKLCGKQMAHIKYHQETEIRLNC